ncbi:uncharacterized protein LOC134815599 isoform X2 [Bolinopsis microptera]|uniref:uncharacterized protein LOC134815599 isoform X2 n=1 Tax=Bolinopsis microptera TaxID=2820187 RepID=UPI0030794C56
MIRLARLVSPSLHSCTALSRLQNSSPAVEPTLSYCIRHASEDVGDDHGSEDVVDDYNSEYISLLPEGTNRKLFNKSPADRMQKQRFLDLKKDIIQLSRTADDPEKITFRFQQYILENPTSHYISLQCIQQMSIAFAAKGDIERCSELLDLTKKLLKHKKLNPILDMNHARIVSNYLFSFMNCPDRERGKKDALEFFEKVKEHQQSQHPVIVEGLSKVLMSFGMVDKMKELLKLAPSSEIQSPSGVLQLADSLIHQDRHQDATLLLETHSDFVDLSNLNADHYALLAKVLTGLYRTPGYKQISRFCKQHPESIKNFTHFPVPLPKNTVLCRNYEIVLHVAAKRKVYKLFRIVGGRNGLTRQLQHISCYEYVLMTQYIVQLCKHYNIPMDTPFWNHLFFSFFRAERRGTINYLNCL